MLTRFSNDYKLVAVCFHADGREDFKDARGVSKSGKFDIRPGQIEMPIYWNDQFVSELKPTTRGGTNYAVLLVPLNVTTDSFTSIREAISEGAKLLESAATTTMV